MNKMSDKELMNILRVPSLNPINRKKNKYAAGIKLLCKGMTDAAISAKEFNVALIEVNKLMSPAKRR